MSRRSLILIGVLIVLLMGFFLFLKHIGTVNIPKQVPIEESAIIGESLPGFDLPEGFSLNIFADDVTGARFIEVDPEGRLLVSKTGEGEIVALLDTDNDGKADEKKVLASGLNKPHGLALKCNEECVLYVAERDALSRFPYDSENISLGKQEMLMDIVSSLSNRHFTRSLLFLPPPEEDILLISVGSSCDVCHEKNEQYASVLFYNTGTGEKGVYAKGLRNAVFMALNPESGKVYATEMGRDNLGDNLPPDEINIIEEGKNYGWPICYGKNIHDTNFDKNTYIRNPCMEPYETPSFVDLQAHSAPLGLAFVPKGRWPEEYWNDLLVAYHGSWNRSTPTGYKVVRINLNEKGEYLGTEDFITGWLSSGEETTGRPVDIKFASENTAYISDDKSGVIYILRQQ